MGRKRNIDLKSCPNCRWLDVIKKTGFCPAKKQAVDLKKPVKNCEKFRKFEGEYYKIL